ncbi:MAG: hypothetical protein H6623_01580 [Bdellovibrionaceae bacterium]|nr:hypothetical protein [Pseudobdellovibrionaceae bacterium]
MKIAYLLMSCLLFVCCSSVNKKSTTDRGPQSHFEGDLHQIKETLVVSSSKDESKLTLVMTAELAKRLYNSKQAKDLSSENLNVKNTVLTGKIIDANKILCFTNEEMLNFLESTSDSNKDKPKRQTKRSTIEQWTLNILSIVNEKVSVANKIFTSDFICFTDII